MLLFDKCGRIKGSYMYQSSGYCEQQCAGYRVAALKNGNECYCGDVDPTSQSNGCNIKCSGWPLDTCGGSSAYMVYINADADSQAQSSSTSSTSTSSTSSSKSTSSSSSSTLHLQHQRNNHLPPPFKQQQPNRLQQNQSLPNNQKQQKNKKQLHHHVQPLNLEPLQ